MSIPFFIIISGPTGVGKTAFVDHLIDVVNFPLEVINADVGQLYEPLSIGTAKPDLSVVKVPHHMFDILKDPVDFTVSQYRVHVIALMKDIAARGAVPLLVGGSGFYLASLFYPPGEELCSSMSGDWQDERSTAELWQILHEIDPERALMIHKHDRYRIMRALAIWYATGKQPSLCQPIFDPPGRCAFYFLTRDKDELALRINARTKQMLESGWLDEVQGLRPEWHEFLRTKKLIGYPEIIKYLQSESLGLLADDAYEKLEEVIAQKTRGYAKRQITFWKHLKKRLAESNPLGTAVLKCEEVNLSDSYDNFLKKEKDWLSAQREGL